MKPRSGLVTDGMERAPARGMLRAVGMGDDDWVKPQALIAQFRSLKLVLALRTHERGGIV